MTILRTTLVATLLGVSLSSFAAMPSDPADREARMEEALQHYRAKALDNTVAANTSVAHVKHAKRHHHMKNKMTQKADETAKTQ